MKKTFANLTPAIIWLAVAIIGCSRSSFSGSGSTSQSVDDETPIHTEDAEAGDSSAEQQWNDLGADGAAGGIEQSFSIEGSLGLVDVFFAFDTSGSMNDEKASLEMNMKSFLDELEKAKIDYRVSAIGDDFVFPVGLPATKFAVIPVGISSNNAISRLNRVFAGEEGPLPLPLRDGARVEVVVVTDDEGVGSGNLSGDFKGPPGKTVVVDSIVGLAAGQDPVNPACTVVAVGQQYINLSNTTKGQVFNLCDALKNFNGILKKISQQIVINTRGFTLDQPLDMGRPFLAKLNDKLLTPEQISYDQATNKIILSSDVALTPGDKLVIRYLKKS